MNWIKKWWGTGEPTSFWEVDSYQPPHWSAKPFRALVKLAQAGSELHWFQRPIGILVIAIIGAVVAAGIAKKLGWV